MKRYQKQVQELEQQNKALLKENEELKLNLAIKPSTSCASDDSAQKLKEEYIQKFNALEEKHMEMKRKLNAKSPFSSQKPKGGEITIGLQAQMSRLKAQKVELQRKLKEDSVQSRFGKALLEKEICQLKKDAWRKEYEMREMLSLNQRLRKVSQRKIEEAIVSTKQLKGLLESKKAFARKVSGAGNGKGPSNVNRPKNQVSNQWLEMKILADGIRSEYEHKKEDLAMVAKEVVELKKEAEILKQRNLKCILQDLEVDCREKDLEIENLVQEVKADCRHKDMVIKDLKEQVNRLKNVVSQLEMQKAEFVQREKPLKSTPIKSLVEDASSRDSRNSINTDFASANSEISELSNGLEVCCECSKKSLCKTTKCMCRAAGGSCGTSCGCASAKCSNREVILIKIDDDASQQLNGINDTKESLGTSESATNILVDHGEILFHDSVIPKPDATKENVRRTRKPISDIKNTMITTNAQKPNRRTRAVK